MKKYLSLIKFSHTIFALPFAFIGFFLSAPQKTIDWTIFIYVVLCMIFARSAAMAFNRYIDREIDKANKRTSKNREIPNGTISANNALMFVILNCVFFISTSYLINKTCFYLSPVALTIILGYSYTKRITALCHLFLGLGLSLAPLGAYLAVNEAFDVLPLLFSATVLFWVSGFDIIYSLQDHEFDKKHKLYSIPVKIGKKNALNFSKLFHVITVIILIFIGLKFHFNEFYWIGFSIFATLLIYQHRLVSEDNLKNVNLAFFTTNGFGSLIFGFFVILDLLII